MKKKEAFALLQVAEHASSAEIKQAFERSYQATKQLLEHAPLESQKQLYRKKMGQYWQAYASLVDVGNPANISTFATEEMTKKTIPENQDTGKPGQFFHSVPNAANKKDLHGVPWKPIGIVAVILLLFFIAWKIIFAIPAPVQQLLTDMEYISGGTFQMGCTPEQRGRCADNELPAHAVSISSFKLGKFEVTREQWYGVMKYYPKTNSLCNQANCPITHVSWEEVQLFLQKLNKMTNQNFRLPTEAEWEYAARGGNASRNTVFAGTNQISQVARTGNAPFPVGSFAANEKQLFNMSGNVWEWCQDGFNANYYKNSSTSNPQGQSNASCKVIRGGSFKSQENSMRVSGRNCLDKNQHSEEVGFRIAITFSR